MSTYVCSRDGDLLFGWLWSEQALDLPERAYPASIGWDGLVLLVIPWVIATVADIGKFHKGLVSEPLRDMAMARVGHGFVRLLKIFHGESSAKVWHLLSD